MSTRGKPTPRGGSRPGRRSANAARGRQKRSSGSRPARGTASSTVVSGRVKRAVDAGGRLARSPAASRSQALEALAAALVDSVVRKRVLEANARDLAAAAGLAIPLVKRLKLDPAKLDTLADGARQLAEREDPLGTVLARRNSICIPKQCFSS